MNALDRSQDEQQHESETEEHQERPFRHYGGVLTDGNTGLSKRCGNCSSHVTADFHRVFSNGKGELHGCWECMTSRSLSSGVPATGEDLGERGGDQDEQ